LAPFVVGAEGWTARRWLDGGTLAQLARMGVGTVRWSVASRRAILAKALARRLAHRGRARLQVVTSGAPQPLLRLAAPPPAPRSDSLADLLDALGGETWRRTLGAEAPVEELASLAVADGSAWRSWPALRRGQPASFLLVSPADESRVDLDEARLESVWIDGVEVRGAP
jgi:hypothetical protein